MEDKFCKWEWKKEDVFGYTHDPHHRDIYYYETGCGKKIYNTDIIPEKCTHCKRQIKTI